MRRRREDHVLHCLLHRLVPHEVGGCRRDSTRRGQPALISRPRSVRERLLRPFGARVVLIATHGLRRGLYSSAAPRLKFRRSRKIVIPTEATRKRAQWRDLVSSRGPNPGERRSPTRTRASGSTWFVLISLVESPASHSSAAPRSSRPIIAAHDLRSCH